MINSSDEAEDNPDEMVNEMINNSMVEQFIADARDHQFPADHHWDRRENNRHTQGRSSGPKPGPSRARQLSPDKKANRLIQESEGCRAKIFDVPGNKNFIQFSQPEMPRYELDLNNEFVHSAMVDENYQLVASHLDESIQEKIIRGDYIDFGKLVPKDRVITADDGQYEMIVRDGKTYWMPACSYETMEISNYHRWDQAFRVYSDVYVRAFPNRASELVQYSHLIHTASQSYVWENVYMYDKDFRLHLSRHPKKSWSIILQQAWAVRLKN